MASEGAEQRLRCRCRKPTRMRKPDESGDLSYALRQLWPREKAWTRLQRPEGGGTMLQLPMALADVDLSKISSTRIVPISARQRAEQAFSKQIAEGKCKGVSS